MDITFEGNDYQSDALADGNFEADLYMQGSDVFCLDVHGGEGEVAETVTGLTSFSVELDGGWVD